MSIAIQPNLFGVQQAERTSDDYYTPAWVFERMGITFDLDVCAPPGGIPWIPAVRYFTMEDDGLAQEWTGRVWMNPPYSHVWPWVTRFLEHGEGVCLVPFARSQWLNALWDNVDAVVIPPKIGSFKFAADRTVSYAVCLFAIGDECVEAISRLGRVR